MRLRQTVALVCLLAAGAARPAWAQTSGSTTMTGTVLTAITVTGSDLRFGNLLSTQTKRVAAAAGGRFILTMAASAPVTIAYVLPASLGPNVSLGAWDLRSNTINDPATGSTVVVGSTSGSFTASTATGTLYLWIGATVTTSSAAIGSYSRPITLTVTYN